MAQALAKPRQAIQRPLLRFFRQPIAAIQPGGQLHHLPQPIQHLNMAVVDAGHDHVKAVGTQINRGGNVRWHLDVLVNPA
jgi:hypothetical protein